MTTKKTTAAKKPAAKKAAAPKKTAPAAIEASGDTAIANADVVIASVAKQSSGDTILEPIITDTVIARSEATKQSSAETELGTEQPTPSAEKQIAVIIPYLKSEAAGEELRYALRSWASNFREDIRVIVIGDSEDWFSPEIVHIPHEPHLVKEDCSCPAPSMIRNPQADVTHKLFTAIAAGEIEGDFILTNDDIFLLGSTDMADITLLKAYGLLDNGGKVGGVYNQNIQRTAKALLANQLPTHRYGTHTPVLLNADKVLATIEKYEALDKAYLFTSLYFNELYPDARPIQVNGGANDPILASAYRHDIDKKTIDIVFATRKFINCNDKGYAAIKPRLEQEYPTPSRFEK